MASAISEHIRRKHFRLWFVVAALSLLARGSLAAEVTAEEKSHGKALLADGLALLDAGHAEEALASFQAAYQIVPSPKVLFNIGLAHQALGHTVQALESFEGFLGELPDAPEDARAYAQRQVELLRANVSFVEISANLPGTEARIDEQWVGNLPLEKAVMVQPGNHVVSIRANGYEIFRQPIVTSPGRTSRVFAFAPPTVTVEKRGHRPWQRSAAWVAAGGAGLALAVGITEHILYEDRSSDYRDLLGKGSCAVGAPERSHCESLRSNASTERTWAWIGYSMAVVSAGAAVAFWLLEPKATGQSATARPTIRCTPEAASPGISCAGRF